VSAEANSAVRNGWSKFVIDSHAHIFPWLGGDSGYSSVQLHRLYLQNAMVGHPQPYRRQDTGAIVDEPDMLWDLNKPSIGGYREAELGVSSYGRVTWMKNGIRYYLQFMPPLLANNEATAELLVAMMDHAGVNVAVLQNDHTYGDLNDYIAKAVNAFPERFIGLIQVDETIADHDDQIARLHHGAEAGLRGLFYAPLAFFRTDFREFFDAPRFTGFWSEVQTLRLPTYWDLAPLPHNKREDYLDQLERFASWSERYPDIPCLLVQAMPTHLFSEGGRLKVPSLLTRLSRERGVLLELTLPISYGRLYEYPYAEISPIIEALYDAVGSRRLVWGSDVPNIERYCTYSQSLTYLAKICKFMNEDDLRAILGENMRLFFGHQYS
jgi:predicted TIM-barrel fold metal-dependent hydrolase